LLNTVNASQVITHRNEIVGTSDGNPNQQFRSVKTPILAGQILEIRERELPSSSERRVITEEEGDNAISIVNDAAGRPQEIWVRWHEVTDFYNSGPRSRHYVINHLTGEIFLGDEQRGMIPPLGKGNIRLACYQTGGGKVGNLPVGVIKQLKTTIPFVDKVINHVEATGGANTETTESLIERAPRIIRHNGRAVTIEDFEDLAKLASPDVARAKCVPLRDLRNDPTGETTEAGKVSVIIVPYSEEPQPAPSQELLRRVQSYLVAHSIATADISVVGPDYRPVVITAHIILESLEGSDAIRLQILQALEKFLHPLMGGPFGTGWEFGRGPHKSDFYALIEAIAGVDHVQHLNFHVLGDLPKTTTPIRILVCSGTHNITFDFGQD
jgi:predicted phage baseplate assembly protein